jgi:hypothetical protein
MRVRGPNGAALLEIPLRSKTFSFLPAHFTPLPFWKSKGKRRVRTNSKLD